MSFTESSYFDIRYSKIEDIEPLKNWLNTIGMLHWYPPSNEEELENFLKVWASFIRLKASLTAVYREKPVGMACLYLMPFKKLSHQALFQIIVAPKYQKKGVGKALVRNLKHFAKNYFHLELLNVEILDESPLIRILKTLDFVEFCRQENYVKEAGEYFPRVILEAEL